MELECSRVGNQKLTLGYEQYCPDDSNCNHQPSSDNQCFLSTNGFFTWEGRANQGCAFTSGVTYYYTLPANAHSYPAFTKVG